MRKMRPAATIARTSETSTRVHAYGVGTALCGDAVAARLSQTRYVGMRPANGLDAFSGALIEIGLRETAQCCVPSTPRGWPGWR
jgi:hypothetical protein